MRFACPIEWMYNLYMKLSESQKILLAKLRLRNPKRYREKMDALGTHESEIIEYYVRELERDSSLKKIDKLTNKKPVTKGGYVYYMGGSPYWSPTPRPTPKKEYNEPSYSYSRCTWDDNESKSIFVMVDGDNNPFHNMDGYEKIKNMTNVDVVVYVANESLAEEYKRKYRVKTVFVSPGDQAVDNQIKTIAGNKAKNGEYDKLVIVSSDQGYREKIRGWKIKYSLDSQDITLCKNFKGVCC